MLCNSNFQELHHLPDAAVQVGARYESVVAAGNNPILCTTVAHDDIRRPAPAPSKSSSTTAAGCTSANGAPRTAAMFRRH